MVLVYACGDLYVGLGLNRVGGWWMRRVGGYHLCVCACVCLCVCVCALRFCMVIKCMYARVRVCECVCIADVCDS